MKSHAIPFENRWTDGEHAWQWHCELERLGVPNVRTMYCEHQTHHGDERLVVFDIPSGFVRDWLAFYDRRTARQEFSGAQVSLRWELLQCRGSRLVC